METNTELRNKREKILKRILAVLAGLLAVLFILFLVEHSKNRKNMKALTTEKEMLQKELGDLSSDYDHLKTNNETLNKKLEFEQEKITKLLEEMKVFKANSYAELNKYRKEINTLKSIMRNYVIQIDSLNRINKKLTAENIEIKQQADWTRERNQKLESDAKRMQEVIARASALKTENFVVYPINKRGRETNLNKCYQLKADFVIAENITAKRGERTVYLRITRPDDKVIAFSADATFKYQNVNLNYTAKRSFDYEGERLEVSIFWPNDGSLIRGRYIAELFSDNENIGSTEFTLK